jgi:hypothetical protein
MINLEPFIITGLFIFSQAYEAFIFLRPLPPWLTWLEMLVRIAAPGLAVVVLVQGYNPSTGEDIFRYVIFPILVTATPAVTFQIVKYLQDARLSEQDARRFQKISDEIEETHRHA